MYAQVRSDAVSTRCGWRTLQALREQMYAQVRSDAISTRCGWRTLQALREQMYAQVRSDAISTSLVNAIFGSVVKATFGSVVKATFGSVVKAGRGFVVNAGRGSAVKAGRGSVVKAERGSVVKGGCCIRSSRPFPQEGSSSQVRSAFDQKSLGIRGKVSLQLSKVVGNSRQRYVATLCRNSNVSGRKWMRVDVK
jgi:hypothetical protein